MKASGRGSLSDESTFYNPSPPVIVRNDVRRPLLMSQRIEFPANEDSTVENADANATLQVIKCLGLPFEIPRHYCYAKFEDTNYFSTTSKTELQLIIDLFHR